MRARTVTTDDLGNFEMPGSAAHPNFYSPPNDITIPGQVGVIGAGGGQHGFFTAEKSGARMIELRGRLEF